MTLTVTPDDAPVLKDKANDQNADLEGIQMIWSDNDPEISTLVLDQDVKYHAVDSDGVNNKIAATLVDQYGDPVKSTFVPLWSDDLEGLGGGVVASDGPDGQANTDDDVDVQTPSRDYPAVSRKTSKGGVATWKYSRAATTSIDEMIQASYYLVKGDCDDRVDDDRETTEVNEECTEDDADMPTAGIDTPIDAKVLIHYWAITLKVNGTAPVATVTAHDLVVAGHR